MGLINPKDLPFSLVKVSTLPKSDWMGLPVFHPFLQVGEGVYWDEINYPDIHDMWEEGDPPRQIKFDVGVVYESYYDSVCEVHRLRFVGSDGSTLTYAADNLWTPGGPKI